MGRVCAGLRTIKNASNKPNIYTISFANCPGANNVQTNQYNYIFYVYLHTYIYARIHCITPIFESTNVSQWF